MIIATYTFGDALLSVLELALLFVWIWIAITVVLDVFRSHDLTNWSKGLWMLFIVVLPYIGVLAYLIVRGHSLHEHHEQDRAQYSAFQRFVARGGGSSHVDDLTRLADLKDRGVLNDDEFERAKARVLADQASG
ncbi:MAG: SHOCT domain-containing protein [Solirubrobacteraceae bacterium]|jgi:hypothetical protein